MDVEELVQRRTAGQFGTRILVIATGFPVQRLRELILASAIHATRCPQGAVVLIAHCELYRQAVVPADGTAQELAALRRAGVMGYRLNATGHPYWRCGCRKRSTSSASVDAFVFDVRPLNHQAVSMMGIRRGLSKSLYRDLTEGRRRDGLRRSILEGAMQPRRFATKPSADCPRQLNAGDPQWNIERHYRGAPPVAAQGVLDAAAVRAKEPLPIRHPYSADGAPAVSPGKLAEARSIFPPAAALDPFAVASMHREWCAMCGQVETPIFINGGPRPVWLSKSCYAYRLFLRCMYDILFVTEGHRGADPRTRRLEEKYPRGHLADQDPGCDSRPAPLHHESIFETEMSQCAYRKGMSKWYAATGMCCPVADVPIPGLTIPKGEALRDWRPPNVIPQKVVVKAKDIFKWRFGERLDNVPRARVQCEGRPAGAILRTNDAVTIHESEPASGEGRPGWVLASHPDPEHAGRRTVDAVLAGPPPKGRTVCNLAVNYNDYYTDGGCFRYTGVEAFTAQLEPGDFISVVDIASFFPQLPMAVAAYRRLLFLDAFAKEKGYQVHTRLPFGASLSPFFASTVSSEVVAILRHRGKAAAKWLAKAMRRAEKARTPGLRERRKAKLRLDQRYWLGIWGQQGAKVTGYMDDLGLGGHPAAATTAAVQELVAVLWRLGIPAIDKDDSWEPRQARVFLGVLISTNGHFVGAAGPILELAIPRPYLAYTSHQIQLALDAAAITADRLESLIGCLSWICCVQLGGRARLAALREFKSVGKAQLTSETYDLAPRAAHAKRFALRSKRALLVLEVLEDLDWFQTKLASDDWTGSRVLRLKGDHPVLTLSIKSDAAGELGAGWFELTPDGGPTPRHGKAPWSVEQLQLWKGDMLTKELCPVVMAARACGATWQGKLIRFGVDNTGVVDVLNLGRARKVHARTLLRELGDLQAEHGFEIVGDWVPREFNELADGISRQMTLPEATAAAAVKDARRLFNAPAPAPPAVWGVPLTAFCD